MQNGPWPRLWDKQIHPFNILPQVEPKQSQGHQKQTERCYFAGSARPYCIHQAITGFNTKTATIFFGYLSRLSFERPNDDVGKTKDAFAFVLGV